MRPFHVKRSGRLACVFRPVDPKRGADSSPEAKFQARGEWGNVECGVWNSEWSDAALLDLIELQHRCPVEVIGSGLIQRYQPAAFDGNELDQSQAFLPRCQCIGKSRSEPGAWADDQEARLLRTRGLG